MTGIRSALGWTLLLFGLVWVLTVRLPSAIWWGTYSANAFMTAGFVVVAFLLAVTAAFQARPFLRKNHHSKTATTVLIGVTSPLPFTLYSLITLTLSFRIEGLQNFLVWFAFFLSVFALTFWMTPTRISIVGKAFRVVTIVLPVTKIVTFALGADFLGQSSFALVALVLLAYSVAQRPTTWIGHITPWLLFFSILLANVRMAAVVAIPLMAVLAFRLPLKRLAKTSAAISSALIASLATWLMIGEKLRGSGDRGLAIFLGDDSIFANVHTSSRGDIWVSILERLPADPNWFGQGAGHSSQITGSIYAVDHPHNEYLRIFFDYGFVGMFVFLAGNAALFAALLLLYRKNRSELTLAGILMIAAVALTALTDNPLVYIYVMVPVAITLATGFADQLHRTRASEPHLS